MSQNKIFIGNLSFGVDQEGLKSHFSKYGDITEVAIPVNRENGRPRGFAFVTFESASSASEALNSDGEEIDGRNVSVKYAESKK